MDLPNGLPKDYNTDDSNYMGYPNQTPKKVYRTKKKNVLAVRLRPHPNKGLRNKDPLLHNIDH